MSGFRKMVFFWKNIYSAMNELFCAWVVLGSFTTGVSLVVGGVTETGSCSAIGSTLL